MIWLGQYRRGDTVLLTTRVWVAEPNPANYLFDNASPKITVYNGTNGDLILAPVQMSAKDSDDLPGIFQARVRLLEMFPSAGSCVAKVQWPASITVQQSYATYRWEIIPTGDPNGSITSMIELVRPEARYLVTGTNQGRILKRKNARIPR